NITGGMDMTLLEVDEAANTISAEVDPDANIIFGAAFDPSLQGVLRVSVVATGMDEVAIQKIEAPAQPQRTAAVGRPAAPAAAAGRPEPIREPAFGQRQAEPAVRRAQAELETAARTIEPVAPEPAPAPAEPAEPRIVGRIVDPSVDDEQGDL